MTSSSPAMGDPRRRHGSLCCTAQSLWRTAGAAAAAGWIRWKDGQRSNHIVIILFYVYGVPCGVQDARCEVGWSKPKEFVRHLSLRNGDQNQRHDIFWDERPPVAAAMWGEDPGLFTKLTGRRAQAPIDIMQSTKEIRQLDRKKRMLRFQWTNRLLWKMENWPFIIYMLLKIVKIFFK